MRPCQAPPFSSQPNPLRLGECLRKSVKKINGMTLCELHFQLTAPAKPEYWESEEVWADYDAEFEAWNTRHSQDRS